MWYHQKQNKKSGSFHVLTFINYKNHTGSIFTVGTKSWLQRLLWPHPEERHWRRRGPSGPRSSSGSWADSPGDLEPALPGTGCTVWSWDKGGTVILLSQSVNILCDWLIWRQLCRHAVCMCVCVCIHACMQYVYSMHTCLYVCMCVGGVCRHVCVLIMNVISVSGVFLWSRLYCNIRCFCCNSYWIFLRSKMSQMASFCVQTGYKVVLYHIQFYGIVAWTSSVQLFTSTLPMRN